MQYDNIGIQIYGFSNFFFIDDLTKLTKHSLYDIVPLVNIEGYEYDQLGNRNYKTLTINRWLVMSLFVPGASGSTAPLNPNITLSQNLVTSL